MGKAKLQRKKPAPVAQDDISRSMEVFVARKMFVTSAISMGWQLAISVLVPVFIGVWLDKKFDSAPSYTLAALIIATGGAIWIVSKTIKQVTAEQAKQTKEKNS